MLYSFNHLKNLKIHASDGEIGTFKDIYFGDVSWQVRYLVVDIGPWILGRSVLLSPRTFERPDYEKGEIIVNLSKEQIENSPETDFEKPVSRQHEIDLHAYYGWPSYWAGIPPVVPPPIKAENDISLEKENDTHLRSAKEVEGYAIDAVDGEIGNISDFIVDQNMLLIRYAAVDTGKWLPGRKVLVARKSMDWISWEEKKAGSFLTRKTIKESPEYDPSEPVTPEYEDRLKNHYATANMAQ